MNKVECLSWKDLVNDYRFWLLILFFEFFIASSVYCFDMSSTIYLITIININNDDVAGIYIVKDIAAASGFLFAWIATRSKNNNILLIYCGVSVLGFSSFFLSNDFEIIFFGAVLVGISCGAIFLTVLSLIAGQLGGKENFLVALGIAIGLERVLRFPVIAIVTLLIDYAEFPQKFFLFTVLPLLLGVLCLIPIRSGLSFRKRNHVTLRPTARPPMRTALFCAIPLYLIYIMYKMSGEISYIAKSNNIINPGSFLVSSFVFPFLFPIVVYEIVKEINFFSEKEVINSTSVIILSIFFPFVIVYRLQRWLNINM